MSKVFQKLVQRFNGYQYYFCTARFAVIIDSCGCWTKSNSNLVTILVLGNSFSLLVYGLLVEYNQVCTYLVYHAAIQYTVGVNCS